MTQAPFPGSEKTPPNKRPISDEPFEKRQKTGGVFKYLLIGCLGIIIVSVLAMVIGGYWLYKNARSLGADIVNNASREVINSSQLPADQKQRMISRIEKVSQDFKDGKITMEQLAEIAERIGNSPMISMGMVYFFEQNYVEPSGLTAEEKADARRTLERLARGVYEKSITESEMNALTAPLMEPGANGKDKLKDKITDAELRDFLTRTKTQVELANVPDEAFEVDMAAELDKVINEVQSGVALPDEDNSLEQAEKIKHNMPKLPVTPLE